MMEDPPYTREKAEKLKNQAIEMSVFHEDKKKIFHLTGDLIYSEQYWDNDFLIEKIIVRKASTYHVSIMPDFGAKIKEYSFVNV